MICLGVVIAKSLRFILVYGTWGLCKNFLGKSEWKSEFSPQIFGLDCDLVRRISIQSAI